jgi:hypothetical protein
MSKGNLNDVDVSIDRSCGRERSGRDASPISARWVPQRRSHEILRDLGMSEDAIAQYFCRFRHLVTDMQQPSDTFLPGRFNCTEQKAAAASRKSISVRRQQG